MKLKNHVQFETYACVRFALMLSVLTGWIGCGSDSGKAPTGNNQNPDSGSGGPLYAVATLLQAGTTNATSLIFVTPSLAAGTPIDYTKAISIPDSAFIFAPEAKGRFYTTLAQTPTVTAYDVDAAGTVTPGTSMSVQQFGVGAANSTRSLHFVSDTKAYLLDDTTLQAIVWNPSTMTTVKAIDLGAMQKAGWTTYFGYIPMRRGNQLVFNAYYYDETFSMALKDTTVAMIDTETDAATVIEDTRCGGLSNSMIAPSGDIYFGSDPYWGALNRIGGDTASPTGCLLRIKAGANAFDDTFFINVKDVTGGQPGGGIVPGPAGSAYLRAFDETLYPVNATTAATDVLGAAAWVWWRFDLTNPSTAVKVDIAPGAGDLRYFGVAGRAYVPNENADYSAGALLDMTAEVGPTKGIDIKGYPSGLVQVR